MKSLIIGIGYYIIFRAMIEYLFENIIPKIKYKKCENKVFEFIFEKHSFILPLIIIFICWLPYIVIYYPGVLVPDSYDQIKMCFGKETWASNSVNLIDENVKITNHHTVLHTVIIGACAQIGKIVGNDSLGIFLYTILQVILLASAFAYIINFMKKIKTNNYLRVITLLIFAVFPVVAFYGIEITKDVPYTAIFIFYVIELYKIIKLCDENKKIAFKRMSIIILLSIVLCLFRNNGFYIVLFSLPFAAIMNKTNRKAILFSTLLVVIIYESFIKILLPIFKIPNTSIREALSIPFQQTARYVKEYGKDVTEEEKEIIDKLLIYETLEKRYVPQRSDNVKSRYNKNATSEDLIKYFKVWGKQFLKHPDVYIQAFINNYYGYFYLDAEIIAYTSGGNVDAYIDEKDKGKEIIDYKYNEQYKQSRKYVRQLLNINRKAPVVSWYTNIALNNWGILTILGYLIYKKKYKFIVYLLPCLMTILVCLASPVNTYIRYAIPNIFSMPLIISIFLDIIKGERENSEYEQ